MGWLATRFASIGLLKVILVPRRFLREAMALVYPTSVGVIAFKKFCEENTACAHVLNPCPHLIVGVDKNRLVMGLG